MKMNKMKTESGIINDRIIYSIGTKVSSAPMSFAYLKGV